MNSIYENFVAEMQAQPKGTFCVVSGPPTSGVQLSIFKFSDENKWRYVDSKFEISVNSWAIWMVDEPDLVIAFS